MDWNLDGNLDILSGCYWTEGADAGQIQILRGQGGLEFAESESVKNAAGEPLENMQLEEGDDAHQLETICTQQHAVDYDGDGDLDLVVGCFGNSFYYYENTATPDEKPALSSPIALEIKSPHHHSAPHFADWDADGDLDLLSGTSSGGVLLATNVGSRTEPQYDDFVELVKPGNRQVAEPRDDVAPTMGADTRVWSTDYNGDGVLDLLVGDATSITQRVPGLSDDEYNSLHEEYSKKMAAAQAEMQTFQKEHAAEFEAMMNGEGNAELEKEMEVIYAAMDDAYQLQEKFQTTERSGYVWLLIRKSETNSLASVK